jgi:hypothetical protein
MDLSMNWQARNWSLKSLFAGCSLHFNH